MNGLYLDQFKRKNAQEMVPWSSEWYDAHVEALGEVACDHLGLYAIPRHLLLSVVIPVFNEERTIQQMMERVCRLPIRKQVLLVDDGSTDRSPEILEALAASASEFNQIELYTHDTNLGKGAALKTGFFRARGDIILIQDADLEYDPTEYPRLLKPIIDGQADIVFGSRFLGAGSRRVLYFWHYIANRLLTLLSNCFTNLNLTDIETCYKVFTRDVIDQIAPHLQQDRFGIEPEITARIACGRWRIFEISVSYSGRTYEEGKHIGWRDGLQALWCIVKFGVLSRWLGDATLP